MSLIHEALQKAESERRSGELPSLLSTSPMSRTSPRKSFPWLPLLAVVGVAGALAYSNRGLIRDTLGVAAPAEDSAAVAPGPAVAEDEIIASAPAAKPVEVREIAPPEPTAGDVLGAMVNGGNLNQMPVEPTLAPEPAIQESAPMPSPDTTAEVAPPTPDVSSPPELPAPLPLPAEEPVASVEAPTASEPQMSPPPAAETTAATPSADAKPYPYVFELPLSTRQALPSMKVTMQVYSPDPANRFAIIDGKRVNEGGVMGNDTNIVEIQRDAILVDFRGQRFLLPRLGR